jgi:Xaa-Pro dipeptidase
MAHEPLSDAERLRASVAHPASGSAQPASYPMPIADPAGLEVGGGTPTRPAVAEISGRHRALRNVLDQGGLDGLLVFGNLASAHAIRWLTGWPPGWDAYLVFPTAGAPLLLVPSENHLPTARALAGDVVEVAWVGPDPIVAVAAAVQAVRPRGLARIGVAGPLPYTQHRHLAGASNLQLIDADGLFRKLRMIKSADEIDRARLAAGLADRALEVLLDEVRPGLRDYQVGAIIQAAYRRAGGEDGICFLASVPMTGGERVVPAQVLTDRILQPGDAVLLELSVGVGGDTSQILRTISLGPPTTSISDLHGVADRTFRLILERVRPGATTPDLLDAAGIIDEAGLTVVDDVVHGYGGGYLPPVLRTPATQHRPPIELRLEPGMMLVIQPNVVDVERSLGVQTGELVVVTKAGAETLHSLPRGLLVR